MQTIDQLAVQVSQDGASWWSDRHNIQAIAQQIIQPFKAGYVPLSGDDQTEYVAMVGDVVAEALIDLDEQYEWDFPRMPQSTEHTLLRWFGRRYARFVLTGRLQ